MIDIFALLMMLMSMTSALQLFAYPSLTSCQSSTVQQWPVFSPVPKICYAWGNPVARRDDYTYTPGIGGHKLHVTPVPWNEGRLICEEEGGHLAIINSVAESKAIASLIAKAPEIRGSDHPNFYNIGFHQLYKKGQLVTIHGQSVAKAGFTEWAPGQPDNWNGNENCGSVYKNGQLNDMHCPSNVPFICELPIPSF